MSETTTALFTQAEQDVLLDVLGFAAGELDADEDVIESAKLKIWNEEPFDEPEVMVIKTAMSYADNHMHRHYMILAAQKLSAHYTAIDVKLDRML